MFSNDVSGQLQAYVYRLIDPRNGETFYVGKGRGSRVFSHADGKVENLIDNNESSDDGVDSVSLKLQRINAIQTTGMKVIHLIHRHGMNDATAFEVEAALIDAYPALSNAQGGHGSSSYGLRHADEIISLYERMELQHYDDKLLLINVNRSNEGTERFKLYDQVRWRWRVGIARAEQADYVLAVVRGVVKGVFEAEEWLASTNSEFSHFEGYEEDVGRFGFKGTEASGEIKQRYFEKRLPSNLRHSQNPIRYSY